MGKKKRRGRQWGYHLGEEEEKGREKREEKGISHLVWGGKEKKEEKEKGKKRRDLLF